MPCPEYSFLRCSAVAELRTNLPCPSLMQVKTDKLHNFTVSGEELQEMADHEKQGKRKWRELLLAKHFNLRFAKKFTSPPVDWDNVMRCAMEREGRTAEKTWDWLKQFVEWRV
ncbi:hypothetical protein BV898_03153 [Hypsibius exemplaris]|uniref:Uncharacterized protein n=1 Tax=Hypsibius exemplaris TaxID=2072580 RepID=A0A1W0X6S9_HYPEX|nr:hypothetical protein BV898_03153 [Hypsibius exemplaris]